MRRTLIVTGAATLLSAVAWAFPWDTDMADAVYLRAFSWKMMTLPEDTISRNRARTPGSITDAQSLRLAAPKSTASDLVEGKRLFDVYCTTCHGENGLGGAEVTNNESGKRYQIPAPIINGDQSLVKIRPDGYLFFLIRDGKLKPDGSPTMPGYGYAMEDKDVWKLIAYLRTMDGNAYLAPEPAAAAPEAQ